jgi:sec-independent protein translocase protein TatC
LSRDKELPLIEHIRELKDRVKVIIVSFIVALIFWLAFPANLTSFNPDLYEPMVSLVLKRVVNDISGGKLTIIGCSVTSPFELIFLAAAFLAVASIMPVIGYETYAYVDPALYPHERRVIYGFTAAFFSLFVAGMAFGYFVAAPLIMRTMVFFFDLAGNSPHRLCDGVLQPRLHHSFAYRGYFHLPGHCCLLVRFGLLSSETIAKNRLYIYGGLYILVAVITPDGWLVGNTILFLPLVLLIETSIFIARRFERSRERMAEVDRCKFCGEELKKGTLFCSKCGKAQE